MLYRKWFLSSLVLSLANFASSTLPDVCASEVFPERHFAFVYESRLIGHPETADSIFVWIPLPRITDHQSITNLRIQSPWPREVLSEPQHGNRYVVLDMSSVVPIPGDDSLAATVSMDVRRTAFNGISSEPKEKLSEHELAHFLKASRLVSITGPMADEAARIAMNSSNTLETARKLYDNVVDTVVYDKSGEGWGRGDSLYACDVRRGNYTDFHSLFMGQARSLGIPTRFVMGFPLPEDANSGEIAGYHCWAEFYTESHGWLPIDASEVSKNPVKRDELFAGLDAHRVEFTLGRDIELPGMKTTPVNYSIYPHVEIDGKVHEGVKRTIRFRELR